MRYLWIGALVGIALLGAACSGSTDNPPKTHYHFHFPKKTTTTTTTSAATTATTLASGPNDRRACASFAALGHDVGKGHRVIASAFRVMFRDMKVAENPSLRRNGHEAARTLLLSEVGPFKHAFLTIFTLCREMG